MVFLRLQNGFTWINADIKEDAQVQSQSEITLAEPGQFIKNKSNQASPLNRNLESHLHHIGAVQMSHII